MTQKCERSLISEVKPFLEWRQAKDFCFKRFAQVSIFCP